MLTKDDYQGYLNEILSVENDMLDLYRDCMEQVEDEKIKKIFNKLLKDERRHAFLLRDLKKMFVL